jgi:uncharacterized protein (TIRG00374 family)
MKKLIVGIAVSAIFIYLALKGVEAEEVIAGLHDKRYVFLLPTAIVIILMQIVRSLRWEILLSPIKVIRQKKLFPITSIGFMAIILAPMRLGEFVRPYLIHVKESVPLGSGFATILIERSIDLLLLLVFLFLVISQVPVPDWMAEGGKALLSIIVLEFLSIILFMLFPEKIKRMILPLTKRLPLKMAAALDGFIGNLAEGFRIIAYRRKFAQVLFLSISIWFLASLAVLFLFYFYRLPFGIFEALGVTTVTSLGISLPAAPGLIGNFQFACIYSLSFWGVAKSDAFTFAMMYYFLSVGINIILGLIFLPSIDIPLRELFRIKTIR